MQSRINSAIFLRMSCSLNFLLMSLNPLFHYSSTHQHPWLLQGWVMVLQIIMLHVWQPISCAAALRAACLYGKDLQNDPQSMRQLCMLRSKHVRLPKEKITIQQVFKIWLHILFDAFAHISSISWSCLSSHLSLHTRPSVRAPSYHCRYRLY